MEGVGSVPFVHLFCSLWMPEVYIDDLKKMEPVMNVGEIKETRKKLMCSVCKAKCGACVRCSHGMFHCFTVLCIFHFLGQYCIVFETMAECVSIRLSDFLALHSNVLKSHNLVFVCCSLICMLVIPWLGFFVY